MNNNENTPWQYKPDNGSGSQNSTGGSDEKVRPPKSLSQSAEWEAPQFIEHAHGPGWYAALFAVTLTLAALVYLAGKDTMATVVIVLVGIIVGVFAAQRPANAKYQISDAGLSINGKLYRFSDYKSFAVIHEGPLMSVNLFPLKRFMPPLAAYFEPKDDEMIIGALGNYLPYEDRKLEGVDRLARRLRL